MQAVSTTAVANAEEKSTLGADAMYATMPLNKASFPGHGRWDATPCGRDEGDRAAVAPVAADATDWVRACCALFVTKAASRAAVFPCLISSSNRRRRAIVWLASSSARWARAAAYAKSKGATWALRSRELWGWRSVERRAPKWWRWCPVERGGGSWWRFPGAGESWRRDAPESGGGWSVFFSVRTGESTLLVGGSGWRYGAPSSVSSPEPASGGSPRLESRDLERALPVSWASRLGCAEDPSLPRVTRFLTGRHVAYCRLFLPR